MVICVGGVGAGKSLLLSALCEPSTFSRDSSIVPTVGVNIFTLNTGPKKAINIRELGGALSPVWPTYLATETAIIFVVDASDLFSTAMVAAKLVDCINLLEANAARDNKVGRLCLVWSKLDRTETHVEKMRTVICLQEVVHNSSLVVTEVLWDVVTRSGLDQLEAWVRGVASRRD